MNECFSSPIEVVSAPSVEPITLVEIKEHLRVLDATEDAYIGALISAARRQFEHDCRRAVITQTLRVHMDGPPSGRELLIPRPPLQSVSSITYTDLAGVEQTFASGNYHVDTKSTPGRVWLATNASWPDVSDRPGAFRIQFVAGYGSGPSAVPEDVKQMLRFLVAHWFAQREPLNVGNIVNPLPRTLDLMWAFKVF